MRLFAAICLMAIVLTPGIGSIFWFQGELYVAKKQAKRQIKQLTTDDELHVFTVKLKDTLAEFSWIHEGEFMLNGEMYDVVKRSYCEDRVTYHVWHDSEETGVKRKIDQYTANFFGANSHHQESKSLLTIFFQTLFVVWPNSQLNGYYSVHRASPNYFENGYSYNYYPSCDRPPILKSVIYS